MRSRYVCVCMRWAQTSTLEMNGRSGGDPLLVERERTCKRVAEAMLMHFPPPKRESDARACGDGEVWLHGGGLARCDKGVLA